MLAYRLTDVVTFQRPTDVQNPATLDSTHGWEDVWLDSDTPLVDIAAEVFFGPGKEVQAAHGERYESVIRVNLRWFAGLKSNWRVLYDGEPFGIVKIEKDRTGRREWRLTCTGGVNAG